MANSNIAEWTVDQVSNWLTGLGPTVSRYVAGLRARSLDGAKLLTLRCDDLEYLGVHVIGHQELILEAVEHLRNFQYEVHRECVQQLAMRVAVAAHDVHSAHSPLERRLATQALADVARVVHAVKPLVCWLDRWALLGGSGLAERRALLLKLSLEAATSAQRDRFAEQPARAVALAAQAIAHAAEYILQDVSDHMILIPASLDTVTLQQGARPLGFDVVPSFCGHRQLADIRFGSPAHRAGTIHEGDEIVQVGDRVVVGWSGEAVLRQCEVSAAAGHGELTLRLRRRGARGAGAPPPLSTPTLRGRGARDWGRGPRRFPTNYNYVPPWEYNDLRTFKREFGLLPPSSEPAAAECARAETALETAASSSDESEPLSPPASPTQPLSHTRLYPPRPRSVVQRRHSVSGASPRDKRPYPALEQFWQELKNQKCAPHSGSAHVHPAAAAPLPAAAPAAAAASPEDALYRRDKAISCSTGLEVSPRPSTCLGVSLNHPILNKFRAQNARLLADDPPSPSPPAAGDKGRGKLDKSQSTPAYDFGTPAADEPGPLVTQIIPESPAAPPSPSSPADSPTILVHSAEKADQILDFRKSSSQIEEAILNQKVKRPGEPGEARDAGGGDDAAQLAFSDIVEPQEDSHTDGPLETINVTVVQQRAAPPDPPPSRPARPRDYPVLKAVKQRDAAEPSPSPLKPVRHGDHVQISSPLEHITRHDAHVMPPLNAAPGRRERGDSPTLAAPAAAAALSPPAAAAAGVRGMFPSSKSKTLKKKNSIIAKGRSVSARAAGAWASAAGAVSQRVRRGRGGAARWAPRHLVLLDTVLLAYRTPECLRADCAIQLGGFTASAAPEVKSMVNTFKVYHTGTVFYFAASSRDLAAAWIHHIHRATLLAPHHTDESKQFSETDYSEGESDSSPDKPRDKFGSLRKVSARDPPPHPAPLASTSLDRKYLRFFSRAKHRDEHKHTKNKAPVTPVPTEHYRSYRRVVQPAPAPPAPAAPAPQDAARGGKRLPKPINYIHASNPNLLDFEKSEFASKPALAPPPRAPPPAPPHPDNFTGFVTLEQFMLKKQEEERQQVYTNRVLMGIERDRHRPGDLRQRLDRIVPDVIYGELPAPPPAPPRPDRPPPGKPLSVTGRDGYETIVYPREDDAVRRRRSRSDDEASEPARGDRPAPPPKVMSKSVHALHRQHSSGSPAPPPPPPPRSPPGGGGGVDTSPVFVPGETPEKFWLNSLRRNDKVHGSPAGGAGGAGGAVTPLRAARHRTPALSPARHHKHNQESPSPAPGTPLSSSPSGMSRLRQMFSPRRVGGGGGGGGGTQQVSVQQEAAAAEGAWAARRADCDVTAPHYPHLQCPPTFEPETYSLLDRAPPPPPPPAAHTPHTPHPSHHPHRAP